MTSENPENLKFEFQKLSNNFHLLVKFNQKVDKIKSQFIQIIETIVEILIEGDKNNPDIFKIFKDNFLIDNLINLVKKKNRDINLQIIKSFSLLISNLSNEENINFILQSKFMDEILTLENENIDNDYLYYYINFIKSLLLKINENTIEFFFHKENNTFPIFINTLKFYNHPDQMVRNVVRNIFLTILKLNNKFCLNYICNLPVLSYFNFLICRMRDMIKTYDKKLEKEKIEDANFLHDEIINDIIYLQDIFSLNLEKINFILTNCIFYYIIPEICNSFINEKSLISKNCGIYILIILIKYIKDENFINCLLGILFLDKLHYRLIDQIKNNNPNYLSNYEGDWDNTKKKKKLTFTDYISFNYNKTLILSLQKQNLNFSENKKIVKKLEEKLKKSNSDTQNIYVLILEILSQIFGKKENENIKKYHRIVSISTGIQIGLSYHYHLKCSINLIKKSFENIKCNNEKYIDNEIKIKFFSFLDSKDDENLIFLKSIFLYLISKKENISNELLSYINLSHPEIIFKNQKENNDEEEIESLKLTNETETNKKDLKKNIKKFDEINLHLNFSNLYNILSSDLIITNQYLISNDFIKSIFEVNQSKYNYDLTSKFFQLIHFLPEKIYRQSTLIFIFKNLNYLILYYDIEENKEKQLTLESVHKNQIKRLVISTIKSILSIIENNKIIAYNCYNYLNEENELLNSFKDVDLIIENVLKNSFILYKNYKTQIKTYPNIFINDFDDEIKQFKNSLFSFLLSYDLYCKFYDIVKIDFHSKFNDEKIEEEKKICFEENEEKKEGFYQIINEEFILRENEKKNNFNLSDIIINEDEKIIIKNNSTNIFIYFDEKEELEKFKNLIKDKLQLIKDYYYNSVKLFFENIISNDKNIK